MCHYYHILELTYFTLSSREATKNFITILNSKCEERIERTTEELKESTARADDAERRANALESRSRGDEEKIDTLEEKLKV